MRNHNVFMDLKKKIIEWIVTNSSHDNPIRQPTNVDSKTYLQIHLIYTYLGNAKLEPNNYVTSIS